jgi:hypothetical protein
MDEKPTNAETWRICYIFGEKVSLKSNARFGVLALDDDRFHLTGDDQLTIQKQEILSMDKVRWLISTNAIRIRTKDTVIIVYAEAFHLTRHIVFGSFQ